MASSTSKAEQSYIVSSLTSSPALRSDGRGLVDFRQISVETSNVPLANGSARAIVGGSEVIVAAKLEVEDVNDEQIHDSGKGPGDALSVEVACTPSAYPHYTQGHLEDLSFDLSTLLQQSLSSYFSSSSISKQLVIVPGRKHWHVLLEAVILSDCGNIVDALFIASRACLWDLRIPRTRGFEYRPGREKPEGTDMELDDGDQAGDDAFKAAVTGRKGNTASGKNPADFELEDYWDDGVPLEDRHHLPVCVTLNLLPPIHFLDATLQEEKAAPHKLHLVFSFSPSTSSTEAALHGMKLLGPGEISFGLLGGLLKEGERYAKSLSTSLNVKLVDEDRQKTGTIP